MTEQTLNKAVKIKSDLEKSRAIWNNIKEKRDLCTGNTSEVKARKFELSITDGNCIKVISLSNSAAYEALSIELKNASIIVSRIEDELEQLI